MQTPHQTRIMIRQKLSAVAFTYLRRSCSALTALEQRRPFTQSRQQGMADGGSNSSAPKEVLTGQDAAELLKHGYTYVDVRTPEEYAGGHVPGSVNIPNGPDFVDQAKQQLPSDAKVVTACAFGRRAALAGQALASHAAFKDVVVFRGSFQAWLDADLPVNKPPGVDKVVLAPHKPH